MKNIYQNRRDKKEIMGIWKKMVEIIKWRDNNFCQNCGSQENLEAHHIKPVSMHPEEMYNLANLVLVCDNCHVMLDRENKARSFRRVNVNS